MGHKKDIMGHRNDDWSYVQELPLPKIAAALTHSSAAADQTGAPYDTCPKITMV